MCHLDPTPCSSVSTLSECKERLNHLHTDVLPNAALLTAKSLRNRYEDFDSSGSMHDHYAAVECLQRSWTQPDGSNERIKIRMQTFDIKLGHSVCGGETRPKSIQSYFQCFGRLPNGRSVCATIRDFPFHFYLRVPDGRKWTSSANRSSLRETINGKFAFKLRPGQFNSCRKYGCRCEFSSKYDPKYAPNFEPCVRDMYNSVRKVITDISLVKGRSIVGYHPSEQSFLKLTVAQPWLMRKCGQWLHKQSLLPTSDFYGMEVHEADVNPLVRFMVDKNIVGCGWLELRNAVLVKPQQMKTRCDLECSVTWTDLVSHPEEVENTPFRILALDIECMSINVNVFPTADKCPVIQVSTLGRIYGQPERDEKQVFCLQETDNTTDGGTIVWRNSETALFHALYKYILEFSPDIITGFNSNKFDLPYLFERADTLKLPWFRNISKMKKKNVLYYKKTFSSAQVGTKESIHYIMPGCITMDVFELIKTNYKLRAYNLNAVSQHFLKNEKKDDMDYKLIPKYQRESKATRGVLAKYCLQDTVLVVLLMDKLQLVTNNIEMARVVGVNMIQVWEKGQSFKILRKLMQYTAPANVFIPTFQKNSEGKTYVPYYDAIDNDQMQTETVNTSRQLVMTEFGSQKKQNKRKRQADSGRTIAFQGATVLEPTARINTNTHSIGTNDNVRVPRH